MSREDSQGTGNPGSNVNSGDEGVSQAAPGFMYGGDLLAISLGESLKEGRNKSKLIWALLVVLGISIAGNVVQFQYLPPTIVVSETEDGRIRPLPTIDQPIFTNQYVMTWAANMFESLYDIPFTEVSAYPGRIRNFMLPKSADQFVQGLRDAGIIDKVTQERRILRGVRTAPPTVTNSFLKNGRYIWVVEMPLSAVFEGAGGVSDRVVQNIVIRGYVGREHLMRSKDGLVIGSIEVYPGRG